MGGYLRSNLILVILSYKKTLQICYKYKAQTDYLQHNLNVSKKTKIHWDSRNLFQIPQFSMTIFKMWDQRDIKLHNPISLSALLCKHHYNPLFI